MISRMAGDRQWCAAMNRAASRMEVMQIVRQWLTERKV
jgi:hypothetical protein